MGYINYLREYIGHQPIIMVGAGALLQDEQGRILLQQRTDNHLWGIPGGALELDETLEEAAAREVQEETGFKPLELELLKVFSGPDLKHTYPNGDIVQIVACVFLCHHYEGSMVVDPEESEALEFFSIDKLPALEAINPPDRIALSWLKKHYHNIS